MKKISTYPEMNEKIVGVLRLFSPSPTMLYAAQRIEELEQELEDAALAVGGALTTIEMLEQQLETAAQRIEEAQE